MPPPLVERLGQRVARQRSLQQAPVRAAQERARARAQDAAGCLPSDLRARGRRCQAGALLKRCMGMPSWQSLAPTGRSLAPAERARNAGARPAGLPAFDSRITLSHALFFLCTLQTSCSRPPAGLRDCASDGLCFYSGMPWT